MNRVEMTEQAAVVVDASQGRDSDVPSSLARLDAVDLRILSELQTNGRITNIDLADRVGLSPPPCLRRMRSLRTRGYIRGFRALIEEKLLGFEILAFVMIQLESQANARLSEFETAMQKNPHVLECWLVSGDTDYVLRCVARNLSSLQSLLAQFAALPNVRNVKSALALRRTKDEPLAIQR